MPPVRLSTQGIGLARKSGLRDIGRIRRLRIGAGGTGFGNNTESRADHCGAGCIGQSAWHRAWRWLNGESQAKRWLCRRALSSYYSVSLFPLLERL